MAQSAADAIKLEKQYVVSDVWVDEEWCKNHPELVAKTVGFNGKKE